MNTVAWMAVIAVVLAVALSLKRVSRSPAEPPRSRAPLTAREQAMYWRLVEAAPERVILAQVAFSAILDSDNRATRNKFSQKVADFVLCDRALTPVAVIELDDGSHRGKERADAIRDRMLESAGYRVVRFRDIPSIEEAKRALMKP